MIQTPLLHDRSAVVRRAKTLNAITIGWNVIEGIVAIAAGVMAGSASLVAFGLDSGIEVSAALILTWRLSQETAGECSQDADRNAQRGIAVSFAALAGYVGYESIVDLVSGNRPEVTMVGIVLATLSLMLMPVLARTKARLAPALGSRAAEAEASQTDVCAWLSAALLIGLGAHAAFGWWWADPIAALVIAGIAAWMAKVTWTADSLEDKCCN